MGRLALIAGLMMASVACKDAASPEDPLLEPEGLVTTISVDRSVMTPGEWATVTVSTRNPTQRAIGFFSQCSGPVFRIFRDGEPVYNGECAIPEADLIVIAPGDSLVSHPRWSIVTYSWDGVMRDTLPSGRYSLIGGVDIYHALHARSEPVVVEVAGR